MILILCDAAWSLYAPRVKTDIWLLFVMGRRFRSELMALFLKQLFKVITSWFIWNSNVLGQLFKAQMYLMDV